MITYKNIPQSLLTVATIVLAIGVLSSCEDKIPQEGYYTFKGETVGQYLNNRPDEYSEYVKIISRATVQGDEKGSTVMALLNSYGYYTAFAPTNEAIEKYLENNELTSVEQMTDSAVNVIALMSVVASTSTIYDSKNFAAKLPEQNLYKKTIYVNPSDKGYSINSMAEVVEKDVKVHNGVVQKVDVVLEPSDLTLKGFFEQNPQYSLFAEAVELTAIHERVNTELEDRLYVPPTSAVGNSGSQMKDFPRRRFFYYTCFVEGNGVYAAAGINDINDLKAYAKQWFKTAYENAAPAIYAAGNNERYTDENNYLNRFVAYHFVNKKIDQQDFTIPKNTFQKGYDKVMDYTETLAPGQTLCLASGKNTFVSDDYDGRIQLNPSVATVPLSATEDPYRGWTRSAHNGILIKSGMKESANGCFHEIEDILTYPREDFRKMRIRLDYTSLFPEFMSNSIRWVIRKAGGYNLPKGYLTNVWFHSDGTNMLYLCPDGGSATVPPNTGSTWNDYQGDEFIVKGNFDFTIKLPAVPAGTYEIRIGYTVNGNRGCAQIYLGDSREAMIAQGIPIDLTVGGAMFGWVKDEKTDVDYDTDKIMHANGAMKGPNSSNNGGGGGTTALRNQGDSGGEFAIRRVAGKVSLAQDGHIYARFRNVAVNANPEFMMDYIEICPASVYDNPNASEPRD